jgi:heterodisulfide reductase subunit B2
MELSYYPGCSLEGTAAEYDESIRTICQALGIKLTELPDWSCCGASSAHVTNDRLAIDLAARNLVIAAREGKDILVPCAACFARLKIAQKEILEHPEEHPGIEIDPSNKILHLNHLLVEPKVLAKIKSKVKKPLTGLKVVPYYGCLTMRPPRLLDAEDYENPTLMDKVLEAIGAESMKWSYKTDCCGGSLTLTRIDIVHKLTGDLYEAAEEAGGTCIVTDCPMCQSNLDTRQAEVNQVAGKSYDFPVFYISELLAVALGAGEPEKWWKKHFVDPRPVLSASGNM